MPSNQPPRPQPLRLPFQSHPVDQKLKTVSRVVLVCVSVMAASVEAARGDDGQPHAWHFTEAPSLLNDAGKKKKQNKKTPTHLQ